MSSTAKIELNSSYEVPNKFDTKRSVLLSNDDFFEKDLFEKEIYEKSVIPVSSSQFSTQSNEDNEADLKKETLLVDIDRFFNQSDEEEVAKNDLPVEIENPEKKITVVLVDKIVKEKELNPVNSNVVSDQRIGNNLSQFRDITEELFCLLDDKKEEIDLNNYHTDSTILPGTGFNSNDSYIEKYSEKDSLKVEIVYKTEIVPNEQKSKLFQMLQEGRNEYENIKLSSELNSFLNPKEETSKRKGSYHRNSYRDTSPSVGVGIILVDQKKEKLLLGRRIDSGLYGLPGGWIEAGEEWEECASRELKEETGLNIQPSSFKHIYTLNFFQPEKNFHAISCVMYCAMDESELGNLYNSEPNKCYGWFWISLSEMRYMTNSLFPPLKEFIKKYPRISKASQFKTFFKAKIDIDNLFENESITDF